MVGLGSRVQGLGLRGNTKMKLLCHSELYKGYILGGPPPSNSDCKG